MCRVHVLMVHVCQDPYVDPWLELDDLPLISQRLARLELHGVRCHASLLNFSSCPALEHLEFDYCDVSSAKKISSESLKSPSITYSLFGHDSRIRIYAPNLVSCI
uniref:Uncharacterized protein n=1 Tax=Arundo donax TaxID=35708 RepID=A0A0A9DVN1_ARUDO